MRMTSARGHRLPNTYANPSRKRGRTPTAVRGRLGGVAGIHPQQADDHGEIAGGVDEEAGGEPDRGDQPARDGRPDDPRQVERARVERDGVHQVLSGPRSRR